MFRIAYTGVRCLVLLSTLALGSCVHYAAMKRDRPQKNVSGVPPASYDFTLGATDAPQGLYSDASGATCCFAGPVAKLPLSLAPGSTNVIITFYAPTLPKHPGRRSSMVVTFNARDPVVLHGIAAGLHSVNLALPEAARQRPRLDLALSFPDTFVPVAEGMGADNRHLSVVLRTVSLKDEAPPLSYRFDDGMAEDAPAGMFADARPAMCCFVGSAVTLPLTLPPHTSAILVTFYEPSLPSQPSRETRMIVTFNAKDPFLVSHLRAGLHTVSVPLPASAPQHGNVLVGLSFPDTFVPREVGMGADSRRLSVVLRRVEPK